MMREWKQPKLDFGESAEAERDIERRIRAERAKTFEAAAARVLRVRPHEAGYKLAGTLAIFVDSPSTRAAGLSGLRWEGTLSQLAERAGCSVDTAARVLRRFRNAGWIDTWQTTDDRGRVSGVGVELQIRQIAIDANRSAGGPPACNAPADAVPGAGPVTYPGAYPGADHRIGSAYYSSDLPSNPNNPPPPTQRSAGGPPALPSGIAKPSQTATNRAPDSKPAPKRQNGAVAAAGAVGTGGEWTEAANALRGAGVARIASTIHAAKSAGMSSADVVAICATFAQHRHRFASAGAIVDRITTGDWPADIGPRPSSSGSAGGMSPAKRAQLIEFARGDLVRAYRAAGRSTEGIDFDAMAAAAVDRKFGNEKVGAG